MERAWVKEKILDVKKGSSRFLAGNFGQQIHAIPVNSAINGVFAIGFFVPVRLDSLKL
jgi:hypothetical protein